MVCQDSVMAACLQGLQSASVATALDVCFGCAGYSWLPEPQHRDDCTAAAIEDATCPASADPGQHSRVVLPTSLVQQVSSPLNMSQILSEVDHTHMVVDDKLRDT